jgi:hypothetical protein
MEITIVVRVKANAMIGLEFEKRRADLVSVIDRFRHLIFPRLGLPVWRDP